MINNTVNGDAEMIPGVVVFDSHTSQTVRPRNSIASKHTTNGYSNSHVLASEKRKYTQSRPSGSGDAWKKIRGAELCAAALHEQNDPGLLVDNNLISLHKYCGLHRKRNQLASR
jgi:hypothetical protein